MVGARVYWCGWVGVASLCAISECREEQHHPAVWLSCTHGEMVPRVRPDPRHASPHARSRHAGARVQSVHASRSRPVHLCLVVVGVAPCGRADTAAPQSGASSNLEDSRGGRPHLHDRSQSANSAPERTRPLVHLTHKAFPVRRAQFELLQLSGGRPSEFGPELDAFRAFVARQFRLGECNELRFGQR